MPVSSWQNNSIEPLGQKYYDLSHIVGILVGQEAEGEGQAAGDDGLVGRAEPFRGEKGAAPPETVRNSGTLRLFLGSSFRRNLTRQR